MRKLLQTGLLVVALAAGCESSKTPTGPGKLVLETSTSTSTTSTTTSVIPGLRYVASASVSQAFPSLPNDMSLFLQPVSSSSYNVSGVWSTRSGLTGLVKGEWVGTLTSGDFRGTLTADQSGCTAEREFAGPVGSQFLQWTGGRTLRDCSGSPLAFGPFTLLKSDAPPPTTTVVPTTTSIATTSIPACRYTLSPQSRQFTAAGGMGSIDLTTLDECGWSASSIVAWITIESERSGKGPATIVYKVGNNTGAAREGALVIGGVPFFVTQAGT